MSLHRRPVSRGRRLAVLAALVMLAGCLLPWYTFVGDLPLEPFRAFDGSGILVFVAALATLALVALPYAAGDRPVGADRWLVYALIAAVALGGVLYWPLQFLDEPAGLLPDRAPGYWIAVVGALALGRAAFDISRERVLRGRRPRAVRAPRRTRSRVTAPSWTTPGGDSCRARRTCRPRRAARRPR